MGRVVIFGSREGVTSEHIWEGMLLARCFGIQTTEVVCGMAAGADNLGQLWAYDHSVPVKEMPAAWDDLYVSGARIKVNQLGKRYNANAGFQRNQKMADYVAEDPEGAAVGFWDGKSSGTLDMWGRLQRAVVPGILFTTEGGFLSVHAERGLKTFSHAMIPVR